MMAVYIVILYCGIDCCKELMEMRDAVDSR